MNPYQISMNPVSTVSYYYLTKESSKKSIISAIVSGVNKLFGKSPKKGAQGAAKKAVPNGGTYVNPYTRTWRSAEQMDASDKMLSQQMDDYRKIKPRQQANKPMSTAQKVGIGLGAAGTAGLAYPVVDNMLFGEDTSANGEANLPAQQAAQPQQAAVQQPSQQVQQAQQQAAAQPEQQEPQQQEPQPDAVLQNSVNGVLNPQGAQYWEEGIYSIPEKTPVYQEPVPFNTQSPVDPQFLSPNAYWVPEDSIDPQVQDDIYYDATPVPQEQTDNAGNSIFSGVGNVFNGIISHPATPWVAGGLGLMGLLYYLNKDDEEEEEKRRRRAQYME